MSLYNNPIAIEAAKEHALSAYPLESIGYIAGGEYHSCDNVHVDPINSFQLSMEQLTEAETAEVELFIHSHPEGVDYPTKPDQEFQISSGVGHGIIQIKRDSGGELFVYEPFFWGDTLETAPLIGRVFKHCVYDCLSLIRDWYRIHRQITIIDCARENVWWENGEDDLYMDNFEVAGFKRISEAQIEIGDVVLAQIRSVKVNHGGIYIGKGEVLHHLYDRCSRRESIYPWKRFITHYLRYVG